MKFLLLILLIVSIQTAKSQSAKKFHQKAILVDTHNDLLTSQTLEGRDIGNRLTEGHSDLFRFKEGGVDIQFFSVWTDVKPRNKEGFYKDANEEIDSLEFITLRNFDKMMLATNYRSVKRGLRQNKLVALIGVEGGHMIENDISKLEALYKRGMRYMTLTWNNSTPWATSAMDEASPGPSGGGETRGTQNEKGLTNFGKQVVRRMNELGVMVDLSHAGEQTFYDALAVTTKPVLLSHSSVYSICPVFRNVKDDQIKAVAKNGGVICINFFAGFIDSNFSKRMNGLISRDQKRVKDSLQQFYDASKMNEIWGKYLSNELDKLRPAVAQVVDHIDYIVKLVGDEYVGIGSDFDGINFTPRGLEDVTTYPKITEELKRRGYSDNSIKKILGGNVLRVMKANFRK